MASNNFERSLAAVLRHEGGYVNDRRDPGGATNKGVTQATYTAWLKSKGKAPKSVKNITSAEVAALYRRQYWDMVKGDQLNAGLDYAVFDYAVNSGPSKAVKDLQAILGVKVDGALGVNTLSAANARNAEHLVDALCDRRLAFLKRLKTWGTFGKGWASRVSGVRSLAKKMAKEIPDPPDIDRSPLPETPKAEPSDVAVTKTPEGKGGALTGIGAAGTVATEAADKLAPVSDYSWILKTLFVVLLLAGIGITFWTLRDRIKAGLA